MSRSEPTDTQRAEMGFPCSYCDALPGDWCLTATTRPTWARSLHGSRWEHVREIVELSGWADMLDRETRHRVALERNVRALRNECIPHQNLSGPNVVTRLNDALFAGQAARDAEETRD